MSEAAAEDNSEHNAEQKAEQKAERPKKRISDWQRFKAVGRYHGIAFLGAITLFGAADAWAAATGLWLAHGIAILNALVAGSILATLFHEWGHFSGARLSGAYSPMIREPRNPLRNPFIFGFSHEKSTKNQFLAMSFGGPVGNWSLVLLIVLLLPLDSPARAMLLAITVARAISVTVFEAPIIVRTMRGGDPQSEINRQLQNGAGDRGTVLGLGAGAVLWLATI